MESIVDEKLSDVQKLFICDITNKKISSKKSTISDKQKHFRQQLASELLKEQGLTKKLEYLNSQLEKRVSEYEQIIMREKSLVNCLNNASQSSSSTSSTTTVM